jgi:hypothetical protein
VSPLIPANAETREGWVTQHIYTGRAFLETNAPLLAASA